MVILIIGAVVSGLLLVALFLIGANIGFVPLNKMVVTQRNGKVYRVLGPGYYILRPLEYVVHVHWEWDEETVDHRRIRTGYAGCHLPASRFQIDPMPFKVRTKDNVTMLVNSVLTIRIAEIVRFMASYDTNPVEHILKQIELELCRESQNYDSQTLFGNFTSLQNPCRKRLDEMAVSMSFIIEAFDIQSIEHTKSFQEVETKRASERRAREIASETARAEHAAQLDMEKQRQEAAKKKVEYQQTLSLLEIENRNALATAQRAEELRKAEHEMAVRRKEVEMEQELTRKEIECHGGNEMYLRRLAIMEQTRIMEQFAKSNLTSISQDGMRYLLAASQSQKQL